MSDDTLTFDELLTGMPDVVMVPPTETYTVLAALLGAVVAASLRTLLPFYIRKLQGFKTWKDFDPKFIENAVIAVCVGTLTAITQLPPDASYIIIGLVSCVTTYFGNSALNRKPG